MVTIQVLICMPSSALSVLQCELGKRVYSKTHKISKVTESPNSKSKLLSKGVMSTCRMPGRRSEKCFSKAVLLSLDRTKEEAARAARVRI